MDSDRVDDELSGCVIRLGGGEQSGLLKGDGMFLRGNIWQEYRRLLLAFLGDVPTLLSLG
jgi:hypothetical protein